MFDTYYAKDPLTGLCLHSILLRTTKKEMMVIAKTLSLRVSTRLWTIDYAVRLADVMLENPLTILSHLNDTEMEILREIIAAGDGAYTPVPIRENIYKLQELGLTVTYVDEDKQLWWLLMPKELRDCLAPYIQKQKTVI